MDRFNLLLGRSRDRLMCKSNLLGALLVWEYMHLRRYLGQELDFWDNQEIAKTTRLTFYDSILCIINSPPCAQGIVLNYHLHSISVGESTYKPERQDYRSVKTLLPIRLEVSKLKRMVPVNNVETMKGNHCMFSR